MWDGFRALVVVDAGRVVCAAGAAPIVASSPKVVAGAVQLLAATALDGVT